MAERILFDAWGDPPPRKISQLVAALRRGDVVAYPTDTCFALGCALGAKAAQETIATMRQLPRSQRLALLCADVAMASKYAIFSETAFRLAQRLFPGPYTLVLPATKLVPRTLTEAKRKTVGIRVPAQAIVHAIIADLGEPLLTTTAIAPDAEAPCADADDVLEAFPHGIDLVVDAARTAGELSTVLSIEGDEVVVLRQGAGDVDDLI